MPASSDSISQQQYDQYTADWAALIHNGNDDALEQAFRVPRVGRITFLTFSIDQILALVSAAEVSHIKARFLLLPEAAGVARFSATLFATDATGERLSEYYIPTSAAATTTQPVKPSPGPSTRIPQAVALSWLTDWVAASLLTTALFTTPSGPLQGCSFEVSTFQDPLAAALPYAGQSLFFNLGLGTTESELAPELVVYINALGSRTQGSIRGLPTDDSFYDSSSRCPPST